MAQTQPDNLLPSRGERVFSAYRSVLPQTFRSPAFWCFVVLYFVAVAIYLPVGGSSLLFGEHLIFLLFSTLVVLAIIPLTSNAPTPAWEEEQSSRRTLVTQVIILLFFVLLSVGYDVLLFNLLIPSWSKQNYQLLVAVGFITPLVLLFALPTLSMRLLGSNWRELGFARGYHSWLIVLASCLLLLILGLVLLFIGHQTAPEWLANIIQALLQAGFPEEVFFRGLLFTRLYRLLGVQWSLLLSTLIFGFMHIPINMNGFGNIGLALAECVLDQFALGLLLTVIFLRTRSLLAGTVFHTLLDSLHI